MFDQPIVERKSSSPLATSLLVLSAVCLLAASMFVGAQIKAQTAVGAEESPMTSGQVWIKKPNKTIKSIEAMVNKVDSE